jgi:hypothetical protein
MIWRAAPPLPRYRLVAALVAQCAAAGLPAPVTRYRDRVLGPWTWGLAWPNHRLAVELAAGCYQDGRLVRGLWWVPDAKANAATLAGWRLLGFSPDEVEHGTAVAQTVFALGAEVGKQAVPRGGHDGWSVAR